MQTVISLVDDADVVLDEDATVKMTELGVEILQREGDETVKILFPWNRIQKVTQRGQGVSAVYHY